MTKRSYFAQRNVFAWERPSIMRKHIYTGAMGNIWANLIGGIFFVYFGTAIGMSRLQWGLMGGISSWLIVAQILSARVVERTGRRKLIWFWLAVGDRVIRMIGILTALWIWTTGGTMAPLVLITAICLANLSGTMGSPPWLSWLADIIPEEEHGTFWGRRSMWIAVATVAAVIPAGVLMDRIPEEYRLFASVGVFAVATIVGVLDLVIHGTIPEPVAVLGEQSGLLRDLALPLRDRSFRPWLIFNGFWTFGQTLGGAFGTLYFVTVLGISGNFLGGTLVLTSATLIGSFLSSRVSGRLVDRYGTARMLFGSHMVWATLPLFWLLATPETALIILGVASIVGGSSSSAAQNAANKLITRTPPADKRASYAAVSSTTGSIAGGLGVMLAGLILQILENNASPVFLANWGDGFKVLFAASLVLRLLSTLLLVPIIWIWKHGRPGAFPR
jgi:MFS family permease